MPDPHLRSIAALYVRELFRRLGITWNSSIPPAAPLQSIR